ncbi:class II aldolase/adducin family protein [Pseudochelatococcus sp. B33]
MTHSLAPGAAASAESRDDLLRREIAACTLLLNSLEILGYSGHVSARIPGRELLLIQPQDKSRAELQPEDLLVCDFDGNLIDGPDSVRPPSEIFLHCEIYRARADIASIAHFHHDLTNVFTLVHDVALVPFKNHAVRWADGIPVHDNPAHVHSSALGREIAATLGSSHAMQIRAHGQIVTAESVRAVFIDSVHFVENAEAAYRAAAIGRVRPLSGEEIADFSRGVRREHHIRKLWNYYVRGAVSRGLIPASWQVLEEGGRNARKPA